MIARLSNVDEFLSELSRDAEQVERRIVRLACRNRSECGGAYTRVTVLASAIVAGRVLRLERECGSYMFADRDGVPILAAAGEAMDRVQGEAARLGLDVRGGVFEA